MANYVIAPFSSVDGIASHAILRRYAKRRKLEMFHADIDCTEPTSLLTHICGKEGERIQVCDTGYNSRWNSSRLFAQFGVIASKTNRKVEVVDHHYWPESTLLDTRTESMVPTRENSLAQYCTAEILNFHYGDGDPVSSLLARVANANTFGQDSHNLHLLAYAINLESVILAAHTGIGNQNPLDLIERFSNIERTLEYPEGTSPCDEFWPEQFKGLKEEYVTAVRRAMQTTETEVIENPNPNFTLVLGFGKDRVLHPREGVRQLERKHPYQDVYAFINPEGYIAFHRGTKKVDLTQVGILFKGKGRAARAEGRIIHSKANEEGGPTGHLVMTAIKQALSGEVTI